MTILRRLVKALAGRSASHPIEIIIVCGLVMALCSLSLMRYFRSETKWEVSRIHVEDYPYKLEYAKPHQMQQFINYSSIVFMRQLIISAPKLGNSQGVLTSDIMRDIFEFQRSVENIHVMINDKLRISYQDLCYKISMKGNHEQCLFTTPLMFWDNKMDNLIMDANILKTLSKEKIKTPLGDFEQAAFFKGLRKNKNGMVTGANGLVLTFFFSAPNDQSMEAIHSWTEKTHDLFHENIRMHEKRTIVQFSFDSFWQFWNLLENAPSSDFWVIFFGHLLMHAIIFSLFVKMRKIGSKCVLALTVIFNGFFSLIISLAICHAVGVKVNLKMLSEEIPFLVICLGFEKHYALTKAVLQTSSTSDVKDRVMEGVTKLGSTILFDYCMEIFVFALASLSSISGLREFCFLSTLILASDCFFLFTSYLAVLTLKMELLRIRQMCQKLTGDSPKSKMAELSRAFGERISNSLTDVIFRRAKLIMIAGFLTLLAADWITARHGHFSKMNVVDGNVNALLQNNRYFVQKIVEIDSPILFNVASFRIAAKQESFLLSATTIVNDLYGRYIKKPVSGFIFDPTGNLYSHRMASISIILLPLSLMLNYYFYIFLKYNKSFIRLTSNSKFSPRDFQDESCAVISPKKLELTLISTPIKISDLTKNDNEKQYKSIDILLPCLTSKLAAPQQEKILEQNTDFCNLTDKEIVLMVDTGNIQSYNLEKLLGDYTRAVKIRRMTVAKSIGRAIDEALPYEGYDYTKVIGQCCENVVGYVSLPVGIAGPLDIDGCSICIPMATTEGCLVASTHRGCKAINLSGGASTILLGSGMTRAPVIGFSSAKRASEFRDYIRDPVNYDILASTFNSTSRFGRLQKIKVRLAGKLCFLRFAASTGDAMGMNMISKGVEKALSVLQKDFPDLEVLALSGNYCTDKKSSSTNWILGRGKSVIAEAFISKEVVEKVLKTSISSLIEVHKAKIMIGSAMAGSIGGFNAHASNIVTAIFIATGQDPAQNIESSNCMTIMESVNGGKDLYISCTMPSIEVGTVGGGTTLPSQAACLATLGVKGANIDQPGENANRLARIIGAAVMAGELSLMSALAAGHLVRSHLQHNRLIQTSQSESMPNS